MKKFTAISLLLFVSLLTKSVMIAAVRLEHCQLYSLLKMKAVPGDVADWVCLAHHESGLETTVINSYDESNMYHYGIFQVNQTHCHTNAKRRPNAKLCNIHCNGLADNALSDDIACASEVYLQHGFNAWYGWTTNCESKDTSEYINGC